MKRVTLYSTSERTRKRSTVPDARQVDTAAPAIPPAIEAAPAVRRGLGLRIASFCRRHDRPLLAAAGALLALGLFIGYESMSPQPRVLTQQDIDAAVLHTLTNAQIPSHASKAYEAVRRSVVRVHGIGREKEKGGHLVEGIGSGVVVVDTGVILTNLHVVNGADQIEVQFEDGTQSDATVIGSRPEHDLAVLQAKKLPDDLPAATLRSTADLAVGDEVIAVGFPFGIGPSVSAGVISGLRREYDSKDRPALVNLIQFDAAVNPGNSGGPLVTADGEVVGIVTAILNPTEQHVFIGIGFAVPIENAASAIGMAPF